MPIVINSNLPALRAQNALTRATWNMNTSMQRLTTGSRINSAKDDPAGVYYARGLSSQLRGTKVATQNIAAGSSMLSNAEGDMTIINDHLERIKDLATQYSNESLSDEEKKALKEEVQQRVEEIDRIAEDSKFNKVNLLDGSKEGMRLQIGGESDPSTNALYVKGVFKNASTGQDGIKLFGGDYADVEAAFVNASTAGKFIKVVEAAATEVTERISRAGIYQNRLDSIGNLLLTKTENLTSAYSAIFDADIAAETANYVKNQILQQTASSMLSQANQAPGVLALKLIAA